MCAINSWRQNTNLEVNERDCNLNHKPQAILFDWSENHVFLVFRLTYISNKNKNMGLLSPIFNKIKKREHDYRSRVKVFLISYGTNYINFVLSSYP